ncbi:hypothetical protein HYPSUDRAFT_38502 [Hypholoma sublateritium FD-334 SS-4]|uniref:Uncharacterized protein n=1 Tax=Hypholoma sublateritium (strain FD-334 SS-4) TaxID=945553 RepID=A0A0D2P0L8_HYPSF|nr:hypothetical protein HYPSUDRAFT_38502 [Hypholoma sublateritium FD-334 SS-4]
MHPSLRCCSARAHTPLIKFLGKRVYPSSSAARHPHPAAPAEFKEHFPQFLARMNSAESSTHTGSTSSLESGTAIYTEFWQAPPRFWKPRVRELEEDEMEAIMSGGASSY